MSSGRAVVSLSLDSTDREDAGNWTCTAQVYESDSTPLGPPVNVSVELIIVGECIIISTNTSGHEDNTYVLSLTLSITTATQYNEYFYSVLVTSGTIDSRGLVSICCWSLVDLILLGPDEQGNPPSLPLHGPGGGRGRGEERDSRGQSDQYNCD